MTISTASQQKQLTVGRGGDRQKLNRVIRADFERHLVVAERVEKLPILRNTGRNREWSALSAGRARPPEGCKNRQEDWRTSEAKSTSSFVSRLWLVSDALVRQRFVLLELRPIWRGKYLLITKA